MATTATFPTLNHLRVTRVNDTLFVALPPELWRKASPNDEAPCQCSVCKDDKTKGYWDTLAMPVNPESVDHKDRTWTVHYPELHNEADRKRMAY